MKKKELEVVAALIEKNGRYLICQRPQTKARGLKWEFVGGKVEEAESRFDAIKRECMEELQIEVNPISEVADTYYEYPDVIVHLILIECDIIGGNMVLMEHLDYRWVDDENLLKADLCPADRKLVKLITNQKDVLFIYNPHAGHLQIKDSLWDIMNVFARFDYNLTVKPTRKHLDGYEIVKKLGSRYHTVICSGGDGTLNEMVNGLMCIPETERPVLGYLPAGSVNDYATSLNIPKDMVRAAELTASGKIKYFDVGKFNEKCFAYVAAFGAFTEVSYETDQNIKNMIGHLAYILNGIKNIGNLKTYNVRVTIDGETVENEYIYGMVTNTLYVAGFYDLSKEDVGLDDGLLEVMLVRKPNRIEEIRSIASYLLGLSDYSEYVEVFKTESITFEPEQSMSWTLDGEYGGEPEKAEISVANRAFGIIVDKEEK